jgi:hypothetical protein
MRSAGHFVWQGQQKPVSGNFPLIEQRTHFSFRLHHFNSRQNCANKQREKRFSGFIARSLRDELNCLKSIFSKRFPLFIHFYNTWAQPLQKHFQATVSVAATKKSRGSVIN